jgi:DNA polymerase-3 subunit delta'
MTHAWLITGPPGSGRSTAALALAAGLVCPQQGCGACPNCRAVANDSHPDVELVRSTMLSLGKDEIRGLVSRAASAPVTARWRVFVVEDADRMTEAAANTLLKAIEEPAPATVWILCAPSPEDLLPTIRSRTRHIGLRVPAPAAVAALLEVEGVDASMAAFAAHASQGHVGRARALAGDEAVRNRRAKVLRIPGSLSSITDAYQTAAELKRMADEDAKAHAHDIEERESAELLRVYGDGATGVSAARVRSLARRAMADLAKRQQQRSSRSVRDELDRHFVDLLGYYRDILLRQLGVSADIINVDLQPAIDRAAQSGEVADTMLRIDALTAARSQLAGNVPAALVCEALMVQLLHPVPPAQRHR